MPDYTLMLKDGSVWWQGEAATFLDALGAAMFLDAFDAAIGRRRAGDWDLDLEGHDLTGIPVVPDIDRAILDAFDRGGVLNMGCWHGHDDAVTDEQYEADRCGTVHCRAGWAVYLAGKAGFDLEDRLDSVALAGALIYAASRPGVPVPDFHASDEEAMADIRACAGLRREGSDA